MTRPNVLPSTLQLAGVGQPVSDLLTQVLMGQIPDAYIQILIGRRLGVGTITSASAWPGVLPRPIQSASPGALEAVSTDATDIFPAGVGGRTGLIEYIDAEGYERFGLFQLNGLTPVPVIAGAINPNSGLPDFRIVSVTGNVSDPVSPSPVVDATFCNAMRMFESGDPSSGNVGKISGRIAGLEQIAIAPDDGIQHASSYQVPRGWFAVNILMIAQPGSSTKVALVDVLLVVPIINYEARIMTEVEVEGGSQNELLIRNPFLFLPLTKIHVLAKANASTITMHTTLQFILLPDHTDRDQRGDLWPPRIG